MRRERRSGGETDALNASDASIVASSIASVVFERTTPLVPAVGGHPLHYGRCALLMGSKAPPIRGRVRRRLSCSCR
jgi:hypothetical protein